MSQTLHRIGWIGVMVGLVACGQGSSLSVQRVGSVDASTTGEIAVAGGTQGMARATVNLDAYTADAVGTELERMMLRNCHTTESQTIDDTLYFLCTGANDQPLRVEMGYPDGPMSRYWFHDDGRFYGHEDYFDGNFTRKVLAEDGKTIVLINSQGEWESVEDARDWQDTADMADMAVTTVRSELDRGRGLSPSDQAKQGISDTLPVGLVKLARTGGDFNHRWATLEVTQPSTAVSAEGGAMRWYDLHLATMVALTADQFCGNPAARGAYFHYEADGGQVYMGQYFIPCNTAKDLMDIFGRDRHAWVVMEEGGMGGEAVDQWVPSLSDSMMPQFRRQVVEVLTPECSDGGRCPGDRI